MAYEVVSSKIVFEGKIIDVAQDVITLPNGKETVREVILHGGASAIVPIDNNGDIIFVRQYRHPARDFVLEIPAGTLEKGEDPKFCAARELEEETGYKAAKLEFVTKMYSAVGFCTEILYLYLATELQESHQNLDPDEFVTIEKYSPKEALEMVFDGRIIDSKTIIGVLAYNKFMS